jgi:hypothetical protein
MARRQRVCGRYAQTDPLTTTVLTVLTVAIRVLPLASFINLWVSVVIGGVLLVGASWS